MSTNEPIPTFKPGIQEKIKKLLALGERGGTEAEAQAAMARAHVLLAKHNLTLSEVQAHGSEPEAPIETDESTPAPLRNKLWRDTIYAHVAELNFCKLYMRRRQGERWYCVVGRPGNIAVVHDVARYLIRTGDELATRGAKEAAQRLAADGVELNLRAWAASFRIGYAMRIAERVREEIRKAMAGQTKDETGTALILAPLYHRENSALTAYMDGQNLKLRTGRVSCNVRSSSGYNAGREAGERASLGSHGVTARPGLQKLTTGA